jgi:hypothetical protein
MGGGHRLTLLQLPPIAGVATAVVATVVVAGRSSVPTFGRRHATAAVQVTVNSAGAVAYAAEYRWITVLRWSG